MLGSRGLLVLVEMERQFAVDRAVEPFQVDREKTYEVEPKCYHSEALIGIELCLDGIALTLMVEHAQGS